MASSLLQSSLRRTAVSAYDDIMVGFPKIGARGYFLGVLHESLDSIILGYTRDSLVHGNWYAGVCLK